MNRWIGLVCVLIACATTSMSAQTPPPDDGRTQYPAFLANSYFSIGVGSIGYLFTGRQLEPGFNAASVEMPRPAVRVDLFGHHFTDHLSVQGTYLRPVRFVKYVNVNGSVGSYQASNAYAGLTFVFRFPLTERVSGYAEAGGGLTSRSGFEIDGRTALRAAHYTSGLVGAGLAIRATPNIDVLASWAYLPGRRAAEQPSSRFYTLGMRYNMRPIPAAELEARRGPFAFPANVVRVGLTTNAAGYGLNTLFSRRIPIFWNGHVETASGATIDYQRNVFHTKKVFAFDLGASASSWKSDGSSETFRTLSAYPMFRFFMVRSEVADLYFNYSLAGPTFISRARIDGLDTGARFTFQDFMGIGAYLGRARRVNAEIGIKHFSNGNLFAKNASIKVPVTLSIGLAF